MASFLFLQKFHQENALAIPFQEALTILKKFGVVGRGEGDFEVVFGENMIADNCTIIGDEETGVRCLGFERPRYSQNLRDLVWEFIETMGCTVFDDRLHTICTPMQKRDSVPSAFHAFEVRKISSQVQLWPDQFERRGADKIVPMMYFESRNPNGNNFQYFDDAVHSGSKLVQIVFHFQLAVCNPDTLRVLRNVALRIDHAITDNPSFALYIRFEDSEIGLRFLESPSLQPNKNKAMIINPLPGIPNCNGDFTANREIFEVEYLQEVKLAKQLRDKYQIELDGSLKSLKTISGILDQLHREYHKRLSVASSKENQADNLEMQWSIMAGAYLGTLIRCHIGAQWGTIERRLNEVFVMKTHRGRICHPHLMVLDHIVNGSESSIETAFLALEKSDLSFAPREYDLVMDIPAYCNLLRGRYESSGARELPLAGDLDFKRLDFTIDSLAYLDEYLKKVRAIIDEVPQHMISNLVTAAGCYLGETIRQSSPQLGDWQWQTYEDFAHANPGFREKRERESVTLLILESRFHSCYPLNCIVENLSNVPTRSAYVTFRHNGAGVFRLNGAT